MCLLVAVMRASYCKGFCQSPPSQQLIPQRFVLLQFELQPFVVEKLGPTTNEARRPWGFKMVYAPVECALGNY
jgi:hypothetical protein